MKLQYSPASQKPENKLKVCPKSISYIPQKVSEVTILITNNNGKLKF